MEYPLFLDHQVTSIVCALEWSISEHLHEHIATIQPLIFLLLPVAKAKRAVNYCETRQVHEAILSLPPQDEIAISEAACNISLVTPLRLQPCYETVNYTVQSADKKYMAYANYLTECCSLSI